MVEVDVLADLKKKIESYNSACNWQAIASAYYFAKKAHEGQFRHSGEAYIIHPLAVANILTTVEADDATIMAG
ncbi:MAG: HD domain-containing protein, partial [Clostridiales bacterium]